MSKQRREPEASAGDVGGAVTGTREPGGGRGLAGAAAVRTLLRRIGAESRGRGRVYLVGGSSAVLLGWRETTVDVDLKLDPEPAGALEAIAKAKEALNINVELAAPDDFIPALPNWRDRSVFVHRTGRVEFFHYDFYGQALAKIERGHAQDLPDVAAMHRLGLIEPARLSSYFEAIGPALVRYPALDAASFRRKIDRALAGMAP